MVSWPESSCSSPATLKQTRLLFLSPFSLSLSSGARFSDAFRSNLGEYVIEDRRLHWDVKKKKKKRKNKCTLFANWLLQITTLLVDMTDLRICLECVYVSCEINTLLYKKSVTQRPIFPPRIREIACNLDQKAVLKSCFSKLLVLLSKQSYDISLWHLKKWY